MFKNTASQCWKVFAFDVTTNLPVTGDAANITGKITKDSGAANAITDTNPTEIEDGYYRFDFTQEETNADNILILPESGTANVQVIGVPGTEHTVISTEGTGSLLYTVTVDDGSNPLDGVSVRVSSDSAGSNTIAGTEHTNSSGIVTFMLDAATVYFWYQLSGYNFTSPETKAVAAGSTSHTASGTAATAAASTYSFASLYNKVGRFLGYTSTPTGADLTLCKEIVQEAYDLFLMGIDPDTGRSHQWSFLSPSATLTTVTSEKTSDLPSGFNSLRTSFTYDSDTSWGPPEEVPPEEIDRMRTGSGDITRAPNFFSIRPKPFAADTDALLYEVHWYPTPDSAYTLSYSYEITVQVLSGASDFIIGSDAHRPCIDALCRYVAAMTSKHQFIPQTEREAQRLTLASISKDLQLTPRNRGNFGPVRKVRDRNIGTITFS
ncbi:MAG: hypothetical protein V3T31_13485 [candidate division Zixibacteria bacterium]